MAVEISKDQFQDKKTLLREIEGKLNYLISARPTAVNMKLAADELLELAIKLSRDEACTTVDMKKSFIDEIVSMLDKDIQDNKNIGKFGASKILASLQSDTGSVKVLTHCNTGSLATAGYGTALGVVRRLHELNRLDRVYLTETRPYNQGARLTAFEMVHDKVPATLICDSMVSFCCCGMKLSIKTSRASRSPISFKRSTSKQFLSEQIALLSTATPPTRSERIKLHVSRPPTMFLSTFVRLSQASTQHEHREIQL